MKKFLAVLLLSSLVWGADLTPLHPSESVKYLETLLDGKKTVPLKVWVLKNDQIVSDLGPACHTTNNGPYGSNTNCSERSVAVNNLMVAVPDTDKDGLVHVISLSCDLRFRWNHCDYPAEGTKDYPVVLERQKDKSFKVFIAVNTKLGNDKSKVSAWKVEGVSTF